MHANEIWYQTSTEGKFRVEVEIGCRISGISFSGNLTMVSADATNPEIATVYM